MSQGNPSAGPQAAQAAPGAAAQPQTNQQPEEDEPPPPEPFGKLVLLHVCYILRGKTVFRSSLKSVGLQLLSLCTALCLVTVHASMA